MSDIRDLLSKELQEELQESFAFATGFGVVFVDREGRHLGEGSNFTSFCRAINADPKGEGCCQCSNQKALRIALEEARPSIYICHAGLVNIEIPLILEGEFVGAITAGQVLCSDTGCFPEDERASEKWWAQDENYSRYYEEIPVFSRKQIEETARALQNLTRYILNLKAHAKMQEEINQVTRELLRNQKKQMDLKNQLSQARFEALQKQIMPHFTFNVLNSISRSLSLGNAECAEEMLSSFSSMLRYTLTQSTSHVTLRQEIDYIDNYLSIQKHRFGDRIGYSILCDKSMETLVLPFFTLQPLVENAIEHGLLNPGQLQGGKLLISCKKKHGTCEIKIMDDGAGIEGKKLKALRKKLGYTRKRINPGEGIGMRNCLERLKLFFGKRCRMEIRSREGKGTTITLSIKDVGETQKQTSRLESSLKTP